MHKNIEALLFDKDGTLFDFGKTWSPWMADLIARFAEGQDARAEALAAVLGFDLENNAFHRDSPSIAGSVGEQAAAMADVLPDWTAATLEPLLIEAAATARTYPAVPLRPLFSRLQGAGLSLGIATNDAEDAARAQLSAERIDDLFPFIAGYDSGFGAKPAPGMCLGFAEAIGLAPARIAMIGDSPHDLIAGRAAGMYAIGVLTGPATAEDLAPYADVVLPDIGHLPDWLAGADT